MTSFPPPPPPSPTPPARTGGASGLAVRETVSPQATEDWFLAAPAPARPIPRRRRGPGPLRRTITLLVGRGSPFTVSLTLHTLVLIILALVITARRRADNLSLELSFASEEIVEEDTTGTPFRVDPDAADMPEQTTADTEQPPTEDVAAAPLPAVDPADQGSGATAEIPVEQVPLGMLLDGREEGRREPLVRVYGGSDATEAAVARALAWLAKQQIKTGRPRAGLWSLKGPYADGGTQENPLAATAMALLAFQGAGNTTESGRYQELVAKGWTALVKQQAPDGSFDFPDIPHQHALYAHAMATAALCELYGMTRNPAHEAPAAAALGYAIAAQGPNGGWRYAPGDPGDMSVTGWYMMALKSGEIAGLPVPADTFARVEGFLDTVALNGGSRYGYQRYSEHKPAVGFTPAVSAEGLLARQFLGWSRDDPRMTAGVEHLFTETPLDWENSKNVYAWYYVTQVVHNVGGEPWARWNAELKELLPATQVAKGREAGSWDPALDQWGPHGGRLFMTCFCTWMLEVYYRHLPLYEAVAPAAINQVHHVTPAE